MIIDKSVQTLVLGGAIALGMAGSAKAFSFADFANHSNLTLNGSAKVTNFGGQDVLRLTDGLWQSGSTFLTEAVSLDKDASFSTAFQFQITDPVGRYDSDGQGADGITFVVQTLANNVGGAGGGIGYEGIANSVGVEFDTWNNRSVDGYNGNHIGINLNGSVDSIARRNLSPRLNDGGLWNAWVDYNGVADLLEVRVSQTEERPEEAFLSYNADLASVLRSNNAFIGFTSGTGGAGGDHDIRSWQFNNYYKPIDGAKRKGVPEPTSILGLLAFSALGYISMLKRKQQQKMLN